MKNILYEIAILNQESYILVYQRAMKDGGALCLMPDPTTGRPSPTG